MPKGCMYHRSSSKFLQEASKVKDSSFYVILNTDTAFLLVGQYYIYWLRCELFNIRGGNVPG